ncbi:TRAP transporter substrate-binding protein [Sulfitobacter sp. 20_GPM-1509m]|jgi:TRAP-type mannitol/chloroaromatic compound transport system substrate-binding protein|uniref:TRAP transporter substrate-binding protein n=1 Tax=Sulfitobacter sp. 20_GPM-1509m TaxID=1380367 RepID=UPI00048A9BE1|nr:TRAP transporter substrate-binding protein [Sulfitobacter sp. 20_GPM-1509m]|tara:strand:+ start:809 stop:1825 length:1017 start_codon:yes stop_codon:yes gene_type:complete
MTYKTLLTSALALGLTAMAAHAQDYSFRFQSSDPAGNPNFVFQQGWTETLKEMSDGNIVVELLPVGSIVDYKETQDAVGAGIIDGHITDTSYFAGKDPAFGLIANPVGAWSDPAEMIDFVENGGGAELMNELLNPYGLEFIGVSTPGLEAFVSKVPLDGVADLEGLKVRSPEGLIANVFRAAGAAPVNLPASEVYTSLDKGVIDAADYSVFSVNQEVGMNDVALHPVYPGFHSLPLVEVSMNKAKWDALPDDVKEMFRASIKEFQQTQVNALQERDLAAVEAAKASGNVTIHDWPAEERAKFRGIARGEWEKVASQSEMAQKVYDSLNAYLESKGLIK